MPSFKHPLSSVKIKKDILCSVVDNIGEVNQNLKNSLFVPESNGVDSQYLIKDINLKLYYKESLFSHEGVTVADDVYYIAFSPINVTRVIENDSKLSDAVEASAENLQEAKIGLLINQGILFIEAKHN
jgi:hypothetical protein